MFSKITKKINIFRYLCLSGIILAGFVIFLSEHAWSLFLISGGIIINQILLVYVIQSLLPKAEMEKLKGLKITFLLFGKTLILAGVFYWGVHLMGDKIIIPVILYMLQLVALGVSLRKY